MSRHSMDEHGSNEGDCLLCKRPSKPTPKHPLGKGDSSRKQAPKLAHVAAADFEALPVRLEGAPGARVKPPEHGIVNRPAAPLD